MLDLLEYLVDGDAAALGETSAHHVRDVHVRDVLRHSEDLTRRD